MITKSDLRGFFAPSLQGNTCPQVPAQIWLSEDIRDFAAFWPRTTKLGAARSWVFQCADIIEVWCETIGTARQIQPLFVAVVDTEACPLALFPLGIERRQGARVLTFLDGGVCDYNAPVLFPAARHWDPPIVRAIWRALAKALPPFDIAILEKLTDHVGDLPNPLMHLSTSSFPSSGHAVTLSGTWADFVKERLPNPRESRRRYRRLCEHGVVKFEIARMPEQFDAFLNAMIRQKSRRYIEAFGKNGFDEPGKRAYFIEMTRRLASGQSVHLSALKLNDSIIATHWGYVVGARFYHLMPSYEGGDLKRYSPGRLLNEHLLEWSIDKGLKVFDFGIGDEEYKNEYCDLVIGLHQALIPRTLYGWTWHRAWETKHWLASTRVWALLKSLLLGYRRTPRSSE